MQGFETKKALLEYLGKDPNDRKLVDRMLSRGEVHMEDGMYYLVDKDAIIKELEARIFFLENEQGKNTTVQVNNSELEEAKAQWAYYEKLYNYEVKDKEARLEKAFNWIKQRVKWVSWDEFHERVMEDEVPF